MCLICHYVRMQGPHLRLVWDKGGHTQPCSPACSLLLAESSSRPRGSLSTWGLTKPLRMAGLLLLLRLGIPLVNSPGGELRKETKTILPKHDALFKAVTARTGLSHNAGLPYLHSYRVIHTVCQC